MRIAGGHTRKVCGLYEIERARKAPGRRAEGTRPTRDIALAKNMMKYEKIGERYGKRGLRARRWGGNSGE